MSPLDCFWEGSKILGPEYPVTVPGFSLNVKWTNLHPQSLVSALKDMESYSSPTFPFASFQEIMKRVSAPSVPPSVSLSARVMKTLQPDADCRPFHSISTLNKHNPGAGSRGGRDQREMR